VVTVTAEAREIPVMEAVHLTEGDNPNL
jgi:hypothetical protein